MPKAKKATSASNPFTEIQNKRRSSILGQKVKGQKRNVLKSRQDQAKERATTLLNELRSQNRTTTYKDGRFGDNMDYDQTMLQRFERERKKQAKRSFALDDHATLTHGGVAIGDVPDSELKGNTWDDELDAEAEREAMKLFQSENFSGSCGVKSRDEIYKEIIAKSKRRKAELYREKEDQERELAAFNDDFRDIMQELQFSSKKTIIEGTEQTSEDKQYDIMARNFAFERKAQASDRLKTKEELAEEQAIRLAKLEEEREARMQGMEKALEIGEDKMQNEDASEEEGDEDEEEGEEAEDEENEEGEEGEDEENEEGEEAEDEKNEEGEEAQDEKNEEGEESESVDLDVEIENTSLPSLAVISLPEKSYPSFYRPQAEIDTMTNLKNEGHLPFTLDAPTSVKAYVALEKYGVEHLAKVILRARVIARQKASTMVRPLLDYLVEVLSSRGFASLYAVEPVLLDFLKDFSKDIFAYFSEKIDGFGDVDTPEMDHISLCKIAAHMFPTTDLWHPISTSVMMLLERWALSMKIEDNTRSRAIVLFGLLYEYTYQSKRYSPAIFVLGRQLDCPQIRNVLAELSASFDVCPMGGEVKSLAPLRLHYQAPPQVELLDPVFHNPADGPILKGDPERSEKLRTRRKYNDERRAAGRNLRRDQQYLQVIKTQENEKGLRGEQRERKRVRRLMDEEDKEVKKIMMQHSGMDTSLNPYSQNKKRKKENPRVGGNKTVEKKT